jgi:4'-phosphopantetheinyl transferase
MGTLMNWPLVSTNFTILEDEIHVWSEGMGRHFPHLESLYESLDLREKDRAARFYFPHDRDRYIVSHGLLRKLLGLVLELPPENITFRYGDQGKPFLTDEINSDDLQFNLSHSGGILLIGMCRRRMVGVDLEEIRSGRDFMGLAERYFSPGEVAAIKDLPPENQIVWFYKIWTQKEAFLKGLGRGLTLPLDSFEVPILADLESTNLYDDPKNGGIADWQIKSLTPALGFVGAVAGEGRDWKLNYHK